MNKAFTKQKEILLSDGWVMLPDGFKGIELRHSKPAKREKTDTIDGKKVPTGVYEDIVETNSLYFPKVSQALKRYLELVQVEATDIKDLSERTNRVYDVIERIDKEFKQF